MYRVVILCTVIRWSKRLALYISDVRIYTNDHKESHWGEKNCIYNYFGRKLIFTWPQLISLGPFLDYLKSTEAGGREGGKEKELEWEQRNDHAGEDLLGD